MNDGKESRRGPFLVGAAVLLIITIALFRLPETFVEKLYRHRPFDITTSGWVYRFLAIAAFAQAAYVGFVLLRTERVERSRNRDPRLAQLSKQEVLRSLARNASGMALLTIVYGLSSFALTGQRGGFWLFVVLSLLQLAWYFRAVGEIQQWLTFQPEFAIAATGKDSAISNDDRRSHYVPPLARGVQSSQPAESD